MALPWMHSRLHEQENRSLPLRPGKTGLAAPTKPGSAAKPGLGARKFGDISNRQSRGAQPKPQPAKPQLKVRQEPKKLEEEEVDFFPEIEEVEDYSDLLPPWLEADFAALCRPWEAPRRPAAPRPPSPPPSPALDTSFPTISYEEESLPPLAEVELEPLPPLSELPPLSPLPPLSCLSPLPRRSSLTPRSPFPQRCW